MTKRSIVLALLALAIVAAGCGSSSNKSSTTKAATAPPANAKKGGTLTVVNLSDVDSLDPAYWYYQTDEAILLQPTQRQLYAFGDNDTGIPSPDLATGPVQVSSDGKTLTIHIKKGIKYSPPYNKEVTSADFKYALNRCFTPKFANGYQGAYFTNIVGETDVAGGKAKTASGVTTPDPYTLVIKLTKPDPVLPQAFGLPCTAPVPEAYASKYDAAKTPTYGQHLLATGPYMIQNDASGKLTGYTPAKKIVLVRNPNWVASTDNLRKAYVDKIIVDEGNDITVGSRQILNGQSMVSGDFAAPPPAVAKTLFTKYKSQASLFPSQGNRFIAFNASKPPFDNVNVRRAALAATDRTALRLTRGGPYIGTVSTHFLPPGIPGFEQAGGNRGPGFDFEKPTADLAVAAKYLKAAGYKNGKYSGPTLTMVADNQPPGSKTAEALESQLTKAGFKIKLREVPHDVMYSKFCQVPKSEPNICPNPGWGKDFYDASSFWGPIFLSTNIPSSGNVNYAQVRDKKLDAMINAANAQTNQSKRANMMGAIDKYVTDQAYYDTWLWDNQVAFASKNVNFVINKWNTDVDYANTSLK
jgi:peptide/nickel transport system substrate-binding protein